MRLEAAAMLMANVLWAVLVMVVALIVAVVLGWMADTWEETRR